MDTEIQFAVDVGREALWVALKVSLPLLLVGLVTGLSVSVLQTVTSIQEATLTIIPKIVAIGVTLFALLPWMVNVLMEYMTRLFGNLSQIS